MNYRRPLQFGELPPSTTLECGETLGDLEPVYELALPEAVTQTYMSVSYTHLTLPTTVPV